jgi:acetyltransferase-like isoleucine patch superfamily enzyme
MTNQAYALGFARVGRDVTIWPQAKIVGVDRMSLGDRVIIDDFAFIVGGASTTIGSFVHIASFVSITGAGELVMGDFTGLASGVRVFTGNENYSGSCLTNPTVPAPFRVAERSFVRIGKHAIVGANAVILPGVEIGEGAVVGANSLVHKDCKPWTVYFGTPARAIKRRPSTRMLELEAALRRQMYGDGGEYLPEAAGR